MGLFISFIVVDYSLNYSSVSFTYVIIFTVGVWKFPVIDNIILVLSILGNVQTPNCKDDYIGKTDRIVIERVIDHNKRDKKSHMLKHSRDKLHNHVWEDDFKLLDNNYQSNIKRKISESLFIRQLKPSLNKQDKLIPLNLYN